MITDQYLGSPHRCYRYTYEVEDSDGEYRRPPDRIHSEIMLGAGHTYRVRFNTDQSNPQIVELLEELGQEPEEKPEQGEGQ